MDLTSRSQIILSKINEFYRINVRDSDDRIKFAFHELIHHWSDVLLAANDATDDELFYLNASRGFLTQIFVIACSKDFFANDHSFTRNIVRICIDLLVNYMDIFTNPDSTSITTFLISNIRLIMDILTNIISFLWHTDIDLFNEQFLIIIREYVDQDMTHDHLTDGILSLIWNVSDQTSFVPLLIKTGYAESIIEWLKISPRKFREDKQNGLIYILQNFVRHDDGIERFNLLDTLNIIQQIQIDSNMLLHIDIIRILLTDINQIKVESMEFLNTLIQSIIDAAEDEKYRHDGSHVCEHLTVLTKLFYNDEILQIILERKSSILELFTSLLIKFYPKLSSENDPLENFTCLLLLNIFWRISYQQEYVQSICDNQQLMSVIKSAAEGNEKNFVDTFMPRTMKSIEQAALEIFKNLERKNEDNFD